MLSLIWVLAFTSPLFASSPLTLAELSQRAQSKNESVQISDELYYQAMKQKSEARGALLPRIQFLGQIYKQDPVLSSLGSSITPSIQRLYRLNARQFLFQGGAEFGLLSQTERQAEIQKLAQEVARRNLTLSIYSTGFQLLYKKADAASEKETLGIYRQQLKDIRLRARNGRSRYTDLYTLESSIAFSEARLQGFQSEVLQRQTDLARLTGEPTAVIEKLEFLSVDRQWGELRALESEINVRPEVLQAAHQVAASEAGITISRAGHFPTLDLAGNYYFDRPGVAANSKWDVALNLAFPIFSGGLVKSQTDRAKSVRVQRELEKDKLILDLKQQLTNQLQQYSEVQQRMKTLDIAKEAIDRAYRASRTDLNYGRLNSYEFLDVLRRRSETLLEWRRTELQKHEILSQIVIPFGELP